jgi:nitrate/nitrite-specific signal transduction histidine kinase
VCRLTSLKRAVLLLYDDAYRSVRVAGSHRVEPSVLKRLEGTLNETPIAQRALQDDDVIVLSGDIYEHVPQRFHSMVEKTTEAIACVPVAMTGRWLGVIFADHDGEPFELSDGERLPLRTLGRAAALVAGIDGAARERERAHRLDERISLTRELHEQVIQRLFALSLVLGAEGELAAEDRARADSELQSVLGELRGALERGLIPSERETKLTLRRTLQRLQEEDPRVRVLWQSTVRVPRRLESLTQTVLAEALRNAAKHADPTDIAVEVSRSNGTLAFEITNNGVREPPNGQTTGLGLRLASIEALQHEGVVEFGPLDKERWRLRLVCPTEDSDGA